MSQHRVLIAGSINMDIVANVERHPVPGETLSGENLDYFPGGKGANQAVAAARAGAHVEMIGAVGDDAFGPNLLGFLTDNGVSTRAVKTLKAVSTGTALIVVDEHGENSIVIIAGANGRLTPNDLSSVRIETTDVLVAQFETPLEVTTRFFEDGKRVGATTILNPAPAREIPDALLWAVDVLVLNETELARITGQALTESSSETEIAAACMDLRSSGFEGVVVATLGARGAVVVTGETAMDVPGRAVSAVDTTGAGDCFVGYLASALARGDEIVESLERANAAASICVQRPGAGPSMPYASEVDNAHLVKT